MNMKLRVLAQYIQEAYEDAGRVALIHSLMEGLLPFHRTDLILEEMEWMGPDALEEVREKLKDLTK